MTRAAAGHDEVLSLLLLPPFPLLSLLAPRALSVGGEPDIARVRYMSQKKETTSMETVRKCRGTTYFIDCGMILTFATMID